MGTIDRRSKGITSYDAQLVAFYSKTSHTVLQHWLWRFLKKQTKAFAPLHKVFAKSRLTRQTVAPLVWTEIFLLYPVRGASITHKLLARGLKTCLCFKDDSTPAATAYMTSVNPSASQLSHVQPMTVPDVYALVTLMGLYLSEASGHQKAYKELLSHVDDGHTLTLEVTRCKTRSFSSLVLAPRVLLRCG